MDRIWCYAWGKVCLLYLEHIWIITSCTFFIIWEVLFTNARWFWSHVELVYLWCIHISIVNIGIRPQFRLLEEKCTLQLCAQKRNIWCMGVPSNNRNFGIQVQCYAMLIFLYCQSIWIWHLSGARRVVEFSRSQNAIW